MLRQKGATVDQDGENAILASVESGSRECFAAMIEGQEDILLKKIRSHSLSFYAIEMKSNLLPLIATITQKQSEEERKKGNFNDDTEIPPNDLNKNEKKKFNKALELNDHYLPYKEINIEIKKIISVFTQIPENLPEDNEILKDEENRKKSALFADLNSSSDDDDDENKNRKENKNPQKEQLADSYLPQIPINSESTKGAYESGNSESNRKSKRPHKQMKRQYSAIEEFSIDNNKIPSLSQEQFNKSKSSNQTLQFFESNDFEEEEEEKENADYEIEEEEEDKNDEKDNIQYEIEEEEEEVEDELDNNDKNDEYEYYEYEK